LSSATLAVSPDSVLADVAEVADVAKLTDWEPMLLVVMKLPPLCGFDAVAEFPEQEEAVVAVAALPVKSPENVPAVSVFVDGL
jgi:hypothetical protein